MCFELASSSTVAVSDAASCTMAVASSTDSNAGPSEPTAPTQAQHVARWNDVAEIPTWARLRGSSDRPTKFEIQTPKKTKYSKVTVMLVKTQ